MIEIKNSLEGLAEVVAKQVEGNALPLLKPIDETHPQLEVVGTAAAKLDVDARAVVEEMMDAHARMDRDAVYQQNEWYKQELKKEKERTLVYKELYEKGVEEIEQKNEEIAEKDKVIEQKDEEIDELKKKNIRLEAQLEYAKNNPQTTNIIQGDQINNNTSEVHSETKIEEIKVEKEGIGEAVNIASGEMENKKSGDIGIFRFIVRDKIINNTHLGKSDEERIDQYNRLIYQKSQKTLPTLIKYLKIENNAGNLKFDTQDLEEIYEHLVECYGPLHGNLRSFKDACHGVTDGRRTNFYWNPQ